VYLGGLEMIELVDIWDGIDNFTILQEDETIEERECQWQQFYARMMGWEAM
jgi:hypothetical protein